MQLAKSTSGAILLPVIGSLGQLSVIKPLIIPIGSQAITFRWEAAIFLK